MLTWALVHGMAQGVAIPPWWVFISMWLDVAMVIGFGGTIAALLRKRW